MRSFTLVSSLVLVSCGAAPLAPIAAPSAKNAASESASSCDADPTFHDLDFWVGTWRVTANGTLDGTNRIDKVLAGCAIVETWSDVDGHEGKSLFYHPPGTTLWKQVWITDRATAPGGAKEKLFIGREANGAIRFQGAIPTPNGTLLDRTTLTPLADGTVRQWIELSRDRGATWQTTFDAIYTRSPP